MLPMIGYGEQHDKPGLRQPAAFQAKAHGQRGQEDAKEGKPGPG